VHILKNKKIEEEFEANIFMMKFGQVLFEL